MSMKKSAKKMARDLGLDDFDARYMELKATLYKRAADAIHNSSLSHEKIAKQVGTSRTRITRIANLGESSLSLEMLSRVIFLLEEKMPLRVAV